VYYDVARTVLLFVNRSTYCGTAGMYIELPYVLIHHMSFKGYAWINKTYHSKHTSDVPKKLWDC